MEVSESFAYFLVSIVVLMIMLMGLTVTINMPGIERWSRHFFLVLRPFAHVLHLHRGLADL